MKILTKDFAFMNSGFHTGSWNMEYDVQRTMSVAKQEAKPLLRVFGWEPWCISLGRNQSINDINLELAYADGYDVVNRPTGGRAIFHAQELTYSIVMPSGGRGIMEVYRIISEALVAGLQYIAPGISIAKSQPDFQKLYTEPGSIPCFSSSARYEIEYNGKKLVGSAQRRFSQTAENENDIVLQHGSILIGPAHLNLTAYLQVDEAAASAMHRDLLTHTITLQELCRQKITWNELAECVRRGFEESWNIEFDDEELSAQPQTLRTMELIS